MTSNADEPREPRAKASSRASVERKPRSTPASSRTTRGTERTDPTVAAFLRDLDHPLKPEIEALRQLILGVDPSIVEEFKWKSPSYRTTDSFATIHLRARDGEDRVWLILHTGAKVKASATKGVKIEDPAGLLEWLAKDRCVVTFRDKKDLKAKRAALEAILREWIRLV